VDRPKRTSEETQPDTEYVCNYPGRSAARPKMSVWRRLWRILQGSF
jgi:hypothetical protein